jgi:hypothetical protein
MRQSAFSVLFLYLYFYEQGENSFFLPELRIWKYKMGWQVSIMQPMEHICWRAGSKTRHRQGIKLERLHRKKIRENHCAEWNYKQRRRTNHGMRFWAQQGIRWRNRSWQYRTCCGWTRNWQINVVSSKRLAVDKYHYTLYQRWREWTAN